MNKSYKLFLISLAVLIVFAVLLYVGTSLYSKLNKVDELNQQLEDLNDLNEESVETSKPSDSTEEPISTVDEVAKNTEPIPDSNSNPMPVNTPTPSPTATLPPDGASNNGNGDNGSTPNTEAASEEEKAKKKQEIDASMTAEMEQLRNYCKSNSNSLANKIVDEIGKSEDAIKVIQEQFLSQVVAAESDCDAQFNKLVDSAKSKYEEADLTDQSLPDWSTQYEAAKEQARLDALGKIANALK